MVSGQPLQGVDWTTQHKAKVNACKSSGSMKVITK
jgi:hypothetical protein